MRTLQHSIRTLIVIFVAVGAIAYAAAPVTIKLPCRQMLHNTPMWSDPISVEISDNQMRTWSAQWLFTDFGDSIYVRMPRWKTWMIDKKADYEISKLKFDT